MPGPACGALRHRWALALGLPSLASVGLVGVPPHPPLLLPSLLSAGPVWGLGLARCPRPGRGVGGRPVPPVLFARLFAYSVWGAPALAFVDDVYICF